MHITVSLVAFHPGLSFTAVEAMNGKIMTSLTYDISGRLEETFSLGWAHSCWAQPQNAHEYPCWFPWRNNKY